MRIDGKENNYMTFITFPVIFCPLGGGLPYITDRDARRNFQKKPLKVTIFYSLTVASVIFIHRNSTGILKIIAKGQQVLL